MHACVSGHLDLVNLLLQNREVRALALLCSASRIASLPQPPPFRRANTQTWPSRRWTSTTKIAQGGGLRRAEGSSQHAQLPAAAKPYEAACSG